MRFMGWGRRQFYEALEGDLPVILQVMQEEADRAANK